MDKVDIEKIEAKLDLITINLHALDIKVVGQEHLRHRVESLEKNQRWVITAVLIGLTNAVVSFLKGAL